MNQQAFYWLNIKQEKELSWKYFNFRKRQCSIYKQYRDNESPQSESISQSN